MFMTTVSTPISDSFSFITDGSEEERDEAKVPILKPSTPRLFLGSVLYLGGNAEGTTSLFSGSRELMTISLSVLLSLRNSDGLILQKEEKVLLN